jgi:hypothetical protein
MRQWNRLSLGILCVLTTCTVAQAADMVCGDLSGLKHPEYSTMQDTALPGCYLIPKNQTQAQRQLYQSTAEKRYLNVTNELLAMKDAAGIAQVDAMIALEKAAQDALQEILNDPVCKATPAQIKTQLEQDAAVVQADINAATNIATIKTAMTTMTTHIYSMFNKSIKCMLIRTGGGQ